MKQNMKHSTGRNLVPHDVTVAFSSSVNSWTPSPRAVASWARAATGRRGRGAELSVRVVGAAASRRLNREFRGKDRPTNVLSFAPPPGTARGFLGDLVLSAPVVDREARQQGKPLRAHWAHLIVHGCLHLLGFDHVRAVDASRMERRERRILAQFGIPDPYLAERGG